MKLKIYEKVDKITLWFYFLLSIAFIVMVVWSSFTDFNLGGTIFFSILAIGSFVLGIKFLKDRNNGKLTDYTIKCERYEVIQ
jgi:hypothetical protein